MFAWSCHLTSIFLPCAQIFLCWWNWNKCLLLLIANVFSYIFQQYCLLQVPLALLRGIPTYLKVLNSFVLHFACYISYKADIPIKDVQLSSGKMQKLKKAVPALKGWTLSKLRAAEDHPSHPIFFYYWSQPISLFLDSPFCVASDHSLFPHICIACMRYRIILGRVLPPWLSVISSIATGRFQFVTALDWSSGNKGSPTLLISYPA